MFSDYSIMRSLMCIFKNSKMKFNKTERAVVRQSL